MAKTVAEKKAAQRDRMAKLRQSRRKDPAGAARELLDKGLTRIEVAQRLGITPGALRELVGDLRAPGSPKPRPAPAPRPPRTAKGKAKAGDRPTVAVRMTVEVEGAVRVCPRCLAARPVADFKAYRSDCRTCYNARWSEWDKKRKAAK